MMHQYFFRQRTSSEVHEKKTEECCIQIPSLSDIEQMHGMPAGAEEDQFNRLKHMTQLIIEIGDKDSALSVMNTDQVKLPRCWSQLFAAIYKGDAQAALRCFAKIPREDTILNAVLTVHSPEYLQHIIMDCIQAQPKGQKQLNSDIVITPKTLEVLIKDIAMTLEHSGKIHFSFGLPTHHAYGSEGSGFCILNKTAIVLKHVQSLHREPMKHIIVGTDVNRDDGLCHILMNSATDMDICHIDVFDSRVYPQQDNSFINKLFKKKGKDEGQEIHSWTKGDLQYFAVDLSATLRRPGTVHPALIFALEEIESQIETAKEKGQKIALFLPTGWDSHEAETAYCGKFVDGKLMSKAEAKKTRFNEADLTYFYENLFQIVQESKEHIERVYWGLEGGYDRSMYEQQIHLLMTLISNKLVHQDNYQIDSDDSSMRID
ncbi:acetylpolyamine aminohydrolase [Legionella sainthelensi]|uniref:Acetylpolyamine aminohydrolase n=1 Tax=Legionella sainthelensi TaxID=28087 RepID=A0A2H5FGP4_9GAMM|nr:acetylpolyamine aminohydrolase [Legionella sainthelensi]AUH70721.1 acetylpolyamine aminohydrolase [Legionella sainthelensi]